MGLTSGFFNSVNGDRKYDALQISSMFDGIIQDGIFEAVGDKMMVTPSAALTVSVGTGRAWFNHTWTNVDSPVLLTVEFPDMINPRIDAVVLEVNASDNVRANTVKIVKGLPASNPINPTLTNTQTLHQYPLAYIRMPVGVYTISLVNITNMVGTASCPFVVGAVESVSVSDLLAQWNARFEEWFSNLKAQLSGDVAANLQNEIDIIMNELDVRAKLTKRGGGSAEGSDWGAGVYADRDAERTISEKVKMLVGTYHFQGTARNSGVDMVSLPDNGFSAVPIVSVTPIFLVDGNSEGLVYTVQVDSQTIIIHWKLAIEQTTTKMFWHWLAIGPQ